MLLVSLILYVPDNLGAPVSVRYERRTVSVVLHSANPLAELQSRMAGDLGYAERLPGHGRKEQSCGDNDAADLRDGYCVERVGDVWARSDLQAAFP